MSSFVETNALLAVMNEDMVHARSLIASLLPGERNHLLQCAHRLGDLCQEQNNVVSVCSGPCWTRGCCNPASGYYFDGRTPRGICSECTPEYRERGYVILDAPKMPSF